MKCKFAALVLAHRRAWLLPYIAEQLKVNFPESVLSITLDRPSLPVIEAVERCRSIHPITVITNAPHPALDCAENFMKLRNFQLSQVTGYSPEYIAIWDDDHLIGGPAELLDRVANRFDLIYATKVFFWDGIDRINTNIPEHTSVFAFRYRPGDVFPENRFIHACQAVHDDPNATKCRLKSFLLDIGYLTRNERERVFAAYKRAGKIDRATLALVEQPTLKHFYRSVHTDPAYAALKKAYDEYSKS